MGKLALNFYFYAHLSRRKNNFQMAQLHYFIDIQIAVRKVYKYRFQNCDSYSVMCFIQLGQQYISETK